MLTAIKLNYIHSQLGKYLSIYSIMKYITSGYLSNTYMGDNIHYTNMTWIKNLIIINQYFFYIFKYIIIS